MARIRQQWTNAFISGGRPIWAGFLMGLLLLVFIAGSGAAQIQFDIPAESAILVEAETGRVLFEKNADMQLQPASLAKIMTMLLTLEAVEQGLATWDDPVSTSAFAASVGGSSAFLAAGETFTLLEMMKAVAIASANDATVAIAEFLAGTEAAFVEAMNQRALELGMTNTRFINSDGLPPEPGQEPNLTTARDVTVMSRALLRYPEVLEWTSTWQAEFRQRPLFVLTNTNRLIRRYEGADGLKTGYTRDAGFSLAATAQRGDLRLISVVLRTGSDQERLEQSQRLLDYGFRNYRWTVAAAPGENVGEVRVVNAAPEEVPVRADEGLRVVTRSGEERNIQRRTILREDLQAPLQVGDVVGEVVAYVGDEELGRAPVVATQDARRVNLVVQGWRWVRNAFTGLLGFE